MIKAYFSEFFPPCNFISCITNSASKSTKDYSIKLSIHVKSLFLYEYYIKNAVGKFWIDPYPKSVWIYHINILFVFWICQNLYRWLARIITYLNLVMWLFICFSYYCNYNWYRRLVKKWWSYTLNFFSFNKLISYNYALTDTEG